MTILDQFNDMKASLEEWRKASREAVMAVVAAEDQRQLAFERIEAFMETLAHPERTADEILDKIRGKLHL